MKSNRVVRFLKILGPGLVTGASDDDPSGIATYAIAGASQGYALLWTALFTFPLMAGVQFICAKIGMVTGRGISGVIRQNYGKALLYPVVLALVVANTLNVGADLGAIADGVNLLVHVPRPLVVVLASVGLVTLQMFGSYRSIARTFKWLTLALLGYIGAAFFARPELGAVLRGSLVPSLKFDRESLELLVGILGTTISPYLFFWQASQEVEEERAMGRDLAARQGATRQELEDARWDVTTGMLFSNVVMYFIILATGATLHAHGKVEIQTAADAAEALRPLAGNWATVLMALGLIGTGLLAVPIMTGAAAYGLAEAFGWRCSLNSNPRQCPEFYMAIVLSTLVGVAIDLLGFSAVKMLYWTAILNGVIAPPLLAIIMHISGDPKIMGEHRHGRLLGALGWAAAAVMGLAALAMLWSMWAK